VVTVIGPRGKLTRSFKHFSCDLKVEGKGPSRIISIQVWFANSKEYSVIHTIASHIKNMMLGVTKGYERRMRLVYAHFPINVSIAEDGSDIEIRNFLGENIVRKVTMLEGVKVTRSEAKDEIILRGNDGEKVSQSAAHIHEKCLVKNKDIRKFLDGIFVSEKNLIGERKSII